METNQSFVEPVIVLGILCILLGVTFYYVSSFFVKKLGNKNSKEVLNFLKGFFVPEKTKIHGKIVRLTDGDGKILAQSSEELKYVITSTTLIPSYYIEVADVVSGHVVIEVRAFDFIGKLRRFAGGDLVLSMNCQRYSGDLYPFVE